MLVMAIGEGKTTARFGGSFCFLLEVTLETYTVPTRAHRERKSPARGWAKSLFIGLRGQDLNLRPSGYEPDELPDCSTPRWRWNYTKPSQSVIERKR